MKIGHERSSRPIGVGVGMSCALWLVVGFLVLAALMGGVLNERGPFDAHPSLHYGQLLDDFGAGQVERIIQRRDQLEVTRQGELLTVIVPRGRDLAADLAQARRLGAWSSSRVPDTWLYLHTPAVPILVLVGAAVVWATAIARNRGAASGSRAARNPHPAA